MPVVTELESSDGTAVIEGAAAAAVAATLAMGAESGELNATLSGALSLRGCRHGPSGSVC
jgi:hypothetical protein